eukprot:g2118.t1
MPESTAATDFTNASIACISRHALTRDVESSEHLRSLALDRSSPCHEGRGFRLLCRQHHATRGSGRKLRLYGWAYIKRHADSDILTAVREAATKSTAKGRSEKGKGKLYSKVGGWGRSVFPDEHRRSFGPLQEKELLASLAKKPIYHVVIRGRDSRFVPPGDRNVVDIVTNYFVSGVNELRDLFVERLDDVVTGYLETGEEPLEAFQGLMMDQGFLSFLEEYYRTGDQVIERNLNLVGRLGGHKCFLHNVIKQNHVGLLAELLHKYTAQGEIVRGGAPWLRLAEPLLPMGGYGVTAFHRAVYDGHPECLEVLLQHAKQHNLEITELRNMESKQWQQEHGKEGMTLLEMAAEQKNFACYNMLAPFFGVDQKKDCDEDQNRRDRLSELLVPRVEVHFTRPRALCAAILDAAMFLASIFSACDEALKKHRVELTSLNFRACRAEKPGQMIASMLDGLQSVCDNMPEIAGSKIFQGLSLNLGWCHPLSVSESPGFGSFSDGGCLDWRAEAEIGASIGLLEDAARNTSAGSSGTAEAAMELGGAEDDVPLIVVERLLEASFGFGPHAKTSSASRRDITGERRRESRSDPLFIVRANHYPAFRKMIRKGPFPNHVVKARVLALSAGTLPEAVLLKILRRVTHPVRDEVARTVDEQETADFGTSLLLVTPSLTVWNQYWDTARLLATEPVDAADNLDPDVLLYVGQLLLLWLRRWTPGLGFEDFCGATIAALGRAADWREVTDDHVRDELYRAAVAMAKNGAEQGSNKAPIADTDQDLIFDAEEEEEGAPQDFFSYFEHLVPEYVRKELPRTRTTLEKLLAEIKDQDCGLDHERANALLLDYFKRHKAFFTPVGTPKDVFASQCANVQDCENWSALQYQCQTHQQMAGLLAAFAFAALVGETEVDYDRVFVRNRRSSHILHTWFGLGAGGGGENAEQDLISPQTVNTVDQIRIFLVIAAMCCHIRSFLGFVVPLYVFKFFGCSVAFLLSVPLVFYVICSSTQICVFLGGLQNIANHCELGLYENLRGGGGASGVNPPDRPVIAIVGPLGAGATFVQQQLLRGFQILREKEYEPTIGWILSETDVRWPAEVGAEGAQYDHFTIIRAHCCVHGSGCRPRQMWPLIRHMVDAYSVDLLLFLADWRCGACGWDEPASGKFPVIYGALRSEVGQFCLGEKGFTLAPFPLVSESAFNARRDLRNDFLREERARQGREQVPFEDDHEVAGVVQGDRYSGVEARHRNFFKHCGRAWFLDPAKRCPKAFAGEDDAVLNRMRAEIEWMRGWVQPTASLQVWLHCDTPALACVRNWDRVEENGTLAVEPDADVVGDGRKYANLTSRELAARVRAVRMSGDVRGAPALDARDIERRARALLGLQGSPSEETIKLQCVWTQDPAFEELLGPPPPGGSDGGGAGGEKEGEPIIGVDMKSVIQEAVRLHKMRMAHTAC